MCVSYWVCPFFPPSFQHLLKAYYAIQDLIHLCECDKRKKNIVNKSLRPICVSVWCLDPHSGFFPLLLMEALKFCCSDYLCKILESTGVRRSVARPMGSEVGEISKKTQEKGQSRYGSFRTYFPSVSSCTEDQEQNMADWMKRGHELGYEKQTSRARHWSPGQHQGQLQGLTIGQLWPVQVTRLVISRARLLTQDSRAHSDSPTSAYQNPFRNLFSLLFSWGRQRLFWSTLSHASLSPLSD